MTIKRIQNVYLVADDMDAMVRFYEQALGLPIKFRDGTRWTQFNVGGSNLSLSSREEAGAEAKGGTVVFETDDLAALRAKVEQGGGKVLRERDMGSHGKTVTCVDPAGNLFQLFERAAS